MIVQSLIDDATLEISLFKYQHHDLLYSALAVNFEYHIGSPGCQNYLNLASKLQKGFSAVLFLFSFAAC